MDEARLRAWWWHRQGLDGSLRDASPAAVLERSGWARSVGGVGPYLTLFARAGTTREAADAAVAAREIHELPSARGCTYVLPASDFALGLAVGRPFGGGEMKTAARLGVSGPEIEALCDAVLRALTDAPLTPDALREATGGAWRSLGEEGKKKGLTTTLPVALGQLQARGDIRRVPVNGRLDQQRYAYVRWEPSPLAAASDRIDDPFPELARRFFRWVGPATAREFQWFSGLGVKAAANALAALGLVAAEAGSERMLLPEDVDAFRAFAVPVEAQYALVGSLDAISATRRDVRTLLDGGDVQRMVRAEAAERPLGSLSDLPAHAILERGRLVGVWEYDTESATIVWATFDGSTHPALERAVADTETFVRDQLGDARSFSLDSPASRGPRIEAIRRMR
jgi:hypothetical protein